MYVAQASQPPGSAAHGGCQTGLHRGGARCDCHVGSHVIITLDRICMHACMFEYTCVQTRGQFGPACADDSAGAGNSPSSGGAEEGGRTSERHEAAPLPHGGAGRPGVLLR